MLVMILAINIKDKDNWAWDFLELIRIIEKYHETLITETKIVSPSLSKLIWTGSDVTKVNKLIRYLNDALRWLIITYEYINMASNMFALGLLLSTLTVLVSAYWRVCFVLICLGKFLDVLLFVFALF